MATSEAAKSAPKRPVHFFDRRVVLFRVLFYNHRQKYFCSIWTRNFIIFTILPFVVKLSDLFNYYSNERNEIENCTIG